MVFETYYITHIIFITHCEFMTKVLILFFILQTFILCSYELKELLLKFSDFQNVYKYCIVYTFFFLIKKQIKQLSKKLCIKQRNKYKIASRTRNQNVPLFGSGVLLGVFLYAKSKLFYKTTLLNLHKQLRQVTRHFIM